MVSLSIVSIVSVRFGGVERRRRKRPRSPLDDVGDDERVASRTALMQSRQRIIRRLRKRQRAVGNESLRANPEVTIGDKQRSPKLARRLR